MLRPRTNTTNTTTWVKPGTATFYYPSPAFSSPWITVNIPPGSTQTTSLHWHETHDEHIEILQGMALVTRDDDTRACTSADGTLFIPRYMRHELQRASSKNTDDPRVGDFENVELIMRERTDPQDGKKEIGFRNMFGVLDDENLLPGILGKIWMLWGIMIVVAGSDGYPVFWNGPKWLWRPLRRGIQVVVTHSVLSIALILGWCVGLKTTYEEYTPEALLKEDKKAK